MGQGLVAPRGSLVLNSIPATRIVRYSLEFSDPVPKFVYSSYIAAPVTTLWRFFARPDAPALLVPPWQPVTVARHEGGLAIGATTAYALHFGPLSLPWITQLTACQAQRFFVEETREGPVRPWTLRHEFEPVSERIARLTAIVTYRLPGGAVAEDLLEPWTNDRLYDMFRYRHRAIRGACERPHQTAQNLTQ